jgi:hypothetical protein
MVRVTRINQKIYLILFEQIGFYKFLQIPYKFYVSFWKMMIISNIPKNVHYFKIQFHVL